MNKSQSTTWELLLILGLVVLFISPVGQWLGRIVAEIATPRKVNMNLNPFSSDQTTTMGPMQPAGNNQPVGHFNVPLQGGGFMNVNASDMQAAIENVKVQGGTPAT